MKPMTFAILFFTTSVTPFADTMTTNSTILLDDHSYSVLGQDEIKEPSRKFLGRRKFDDFEGGEKSPAYKIMPEKLSFIHNFILPQEDARNVIYLMIAMQTIDGTSPYEIDDRDRVNVAKILGHLNPIELTKDQLYDLLFVVEAHIRLIMAQRPNLMRSVLYVGKASNLRHRASSHKHDIGQEISQFQTNKARWIADTTKRFFVKMTPFLIDIPPHYLDIFECLVAHLFSVIDFKGSAQIGSTSAWKKFIKYLKSPRRIELLKNSDLLDVAERDRERLRDLILPFNNPWPKRNDIAPLP